MEFDDSGAELGLSFDFEEPTLDSSAAAAAAPSPAADHGGGGKRSFRKTVCRHWLRGLCMKGEGCGFLHQYDKDRMPLCRFYRLYGECREQDCVYKHSNDDIKECNMYKMGFCPNGPDCRYKHVKLPGPPPPIEEVLQKIQQITSYNYGNSNRFFQNRYTNDKPQFAQGQNGPNQGLDAKFPMTESSSMQMHQSQPSQQQVGQNHLQNFPNGQQNQENKTAIPLPQGISRLKRGGPSLSLKGFTAKDLAPLFGYFIVKSCNRENFELSVQQGVWATQRANEAKLNEAFDSVENVILIFSVNRTRNFQGCARMTSRTGGYVGGGNWKYEHGTAHYGRNFSVKWLKLCELSFQKTRFLRNPFNENLPVKISRDCQELEPSIGEQLASLLYLEPDSELMAISLAAEAKREEEKAKGVNPENGTQNPDIVPFEDNEEEEEEEDEDEEEEEEESDEDYNYAPSSGPRPIRNFPHMPPPRGGPRPIRNFPYGISNDFFPMGNMGPRPFGPFGPFNDFPGPGMMFPGRPPFGMPGPGRAPFMGPARGFRPPPPQQVSNRPIRRFVTNDNRNERFTETEPYKKRSLQKGLGNDGSESEDEAPRRSRHVDGK